MVLMIFNWTFINIFLDYVRKINIYFSHTGMLHLKIILYLIFWLILLDLRNVLNILIILIIYMITSLCVLTGKFSFWICF